MNMHMLDCHLLLAATAKATKRFDLRCEGAVQSHEGQPSRVLLGKCLNAIECVGLFHGQRMSNSHLNNQHRLDFVLWLSTINSRRSIEAGDRLPCQITAYGS
jgi:hypothetical protein